jgi:hypothetical protein
MSQVRSVDGILKGKRQMGRLDYRSLVALVADRQLAPAKRLTVGQLRIATVPRVIRPEREGPFDPSWLTPLQLLPSVRR